MSFMDKIKTMMNAPMDDDDYYDGLSDDLTFSEKEDDMEDTISAVPPSPVEKKNQVVNIHASTQLQVVLVKPERVADAPSIADHLNEKRTVVLNLEGASKDVSRRLVDFLSGVAYANKGTIKRVANSTFIITPFNVDIMGDMLIDELESNGMYI